MNRFLILLICLINIGASTSTNWELVKEKNGIRVFSAKFPEYPVKSIKAEMEFNADVPKVTAVLMDVTNYKNWVYHCKESTILKKISPTEIVYHHVTDAPWPVSDRDQVSHFKLTQKPDGSAFINSHTVSHMLEEQEGLVRVKNAKAQWKLVPDSHGKTKATYELYFDPAGDVPAWVINAFIANGPYESMIKLKSLIR